MAYNLVWHNGKWYVQSATGKYLGGYTTRVLAESLLKDLEAQE
jgi:hypothetical protein